MIENEPLIGLEVAVIGMAGRFPGARYIDEYWGNIKNGVEAVYFFSEEELEKAGVSSEVYSDPDYVKSGVGFLEGMEYFDAVFFGYTLIEAELLDPQVRFFHECSWEALEDAGYVPESYEGIIGLFGGAEDNHDWRDRVMSAASDPAAENTRLLLSSKDFVTARVSYKLNLKGPVYAIVTGCSTALTSIHLACRSLLGGECDMALAGGVYLHPSSHKGYRYEPGALQSRDGHLRAFDARASGAVFSSGVGIVVLKTLEDARADNDHIYAVIKGSAVNCDGNRKVNFTAPGVKGQAQVIEAAYRAADVEMETIGYLETHGTGTLLGDPIEINALKQAFNINPEWKCPIGSVKSNIGHLDVAAGAASFIKTVLILKHKLIPPSLHFETPNPKLELEISPFYVNTQLQELKSRGAPRRVGVSSFGFGGTNAHVILEEAPGADDGRQMTDDRGQSQSRGGVSPPQKSREYQLILLSAKTPSALDKMTQNLVEYFRKNLLNHGNHENPVNPEQNPGQNSGPPLADLAYTLQVGRQPFQYRKACVCSNLGEAVHALLSSPQGASGEDPPVVFMFSGQGSQYVNMGLEIYRSEPVFREETDNGFNILKSLTGKDLKDIFYPNRDTADMDEAQERMNDAHNSGPLKFIFEYSLGKLLMSWGIHPHAVMGHSFGEYTAACLAGVFSTADALKLALLRGELMLRTPPGGMMSIPLSEYQLNLYLQSHPGISIAAVNSSSLCFVSGADEALERFEKELQEKGVECMRINFPRAAHSKMMKSITGEFAKGLGEIKLHEPTIPFISGLTGDWISPGEITNPTYWAKHLEQPVRFCQAVEKMFGEPDCIFVQVGPDKGLPLFVNQHRDLKPGTLVLNMLRHKKDRVTDMYYLLNQLGKLWLHGVRIDWPGFYNGEPRHRIPLPTYPFEGKRYWIDVEPPAHKPGNFSPVRLGKRKNVSDWLYTLSWKRCCLAKKSTRDIHENTLCLIFSDTGKLGSRLGGLLEKKGQEVIIVKPGERFEAENGQIYHINPTEGSDYDLLFSDLKTRGKIPRLMIHLWNVTGEKAPGLKFTPLERTLDQGLYSLLHIVQSMGRLHIHEAMHLEVITDNMLQVVGEEVLCPAKATVLGAVRVIPLEYPNISCHSLDIILPEPGSPGEKQLLRQLLDAFTHQSFGKIDPVMAFRGNHYWKPDFEHIPVEKPQSIPSRLRQGGVYLVTGGLGGIGFVLAEYLVKTVKAKLILTGRSQLPAKEQWQQWLDKHQQEDRVGHRIKKVMNLERLGAEVLVFSADSADQEQMQEVITRSTAHFGQVNGIIHTAGLVDEFGVIQNRTREMTENILAPKVKGTMILDQLTRDMPLDFFIICSSIASLTPGFGEVGYAAANMFIDAFAHYKNLNGSAFTTAVNWDTWQEVGAAVDIVKRQKQAGKTSYVRLQDGIRPTEGVEAFTLILEDPVPQVVVSTKNLHLLLKQYSISKIQEKADPEQTEETAATGARRDLRPRPGLSSPYVDPANPTQQALANIWQDYFGFDRVGIHDDFFELGGDSLMATIMAARIHKRMNVRIPLTEIFQGPTVEQLSKYIKDQEEEEFESIPLVEKKEFYWLSPAQKRLFILQQLEAGLISYNSPDFFILEGELDKERLNRSLNKMIRRHESLRTTFEMTAGVPVQRVADHIDSEVEYYTGSEDQARSIVRGFVRPFDLYSAPLLRVGLIHLHPPPFGHTSPASPATHQKESCVNKYIYMFDMHHIITDGTSLGIFANEFLALYEGRQLPPLTVQYKDFSQWQNQLLGSEEIKKQEQYWLKEFAGEIPLLDLPTDYPRPEVQNFEGRKFQVRLNPGDTQGLNRLSREQDVTLYMTTLAVIKVLFSRLSSQETIIMGTITAGRQHEDLQHIIGMFVNTLALKSHPAWDKTFIQYLQELKQKSLAVFENQDYPFEELVSKLNLDRHMNRNPLFDVMISFQNFEAPSIETSQSQSRSTTRSTAQLSKKAYAFEDLTARFDLTLFVMETAETLLFKFEYCSKLFKSETMERFGNYLKKIVAVILETPGIRLGNIEIITVEEKHRVLFEFNNTEVDYFREITIHELFARQVQRTPNHAALIGMEHGTWSMEKHLEGTKGFAPLPVTMSVTYNELNKRSKRLAHLLKEKGVVSDTIVAIMMKRSIEMIIGILGILEAGGAYLPIDPDYPQDRVDFMLKDSKTKILLDASDLTSAIEPSLSTSTLTLTCQVNSTNLAYIIYTSGSTGKPKGVLVKHQSAVNILVALQREYPLGEEDTYLFKTSYLFDVSITELFGWFLDSGRLALLEKEGEKDPQKILAAIQRFRVTHINFVPSMFNVFLEGLDAGNIDKLSGLKYIFLAGEALPSQLVRKFRNLGTKILLENIYGPTEGTIYSCNYSLSYWQDQGSIPIGKPMQNVRLYILDKYLHLQPTGINGELCISGTGLAVGYLNRPELTGEQFIANPYIERERLYRTGDLAMWLPNGNIEFLGRIDHQVKIRGFRIELGEIESQLLNHEEIKDAVVAAKKMMERRNTPSDNDSDKCLCVYFVSEKELTVSELREYLSRQLPNHMIPSHFMQLDRIPLTLQGKIDRKALPVPDSSRPKLEATYVAPQNDLEKIIADVWQRVLKMEIVGVNDNFFDIGGNSLNIIDLSGKLKSGLEKDIPIVRIFQYPTIASFAAYLERDNFIELEKENEDHWAGELENTKNRFRQRRQRDIE